MSAAEKKTESSQDVLKFVEELKRQWVATIDALIDPLMIVQPDYRITKANQALAQVTGKAGVKEVLGKKCFQVFANRTSPCPGCALQDTAKNGNPHTFELDGVRPDQFYEVSSQPIKGPDGALEGIVHVYRDRTSAKKLQAQLTQSEKLASIGMLAGGIAHEINNPLGGILIFSQMLLRELDKNSTHYADVVEIEAATQRCKEIVESLLDFARAQPAAGTSKKEAEVFDANEALQTALRFAKVNPNSMQIEIHQNLKVPTAKVVGTRNKIIQLFLNLLQNAMQAMPDGGDIHIRSSLEKENGRQKVRFAIQDTGVGIPPETINKIFDPFYTTKDPGEGTGLGLAICYGIVEEHGGHIHVESTVNAGTTFSFSLFCAE